MPKTFIKTYSLPPVSRTEALRYAGVRGETSKEVERLFTECERESLSLVTPRACGCILVKEELYSLLPSARESKALQAALCGEEEVLLFAATVGLETDRAILRYASVAPSKSLLLQAIGAERIERLCDSVCEAEGFFGRRFSPGYADFPLQAQRDIFRLLDCARGIGLTLTDSLLMSPTKSVTAIVGRTKREEKRSCAACEKQDCAYRI